MEHSDAGEGTSDPPSSPLLSPELPAGQATTSLTPSTPASPSEAQPAARQEPEVPKEEVDTSRQLDHSDPEKNKKKPDPDLLFQRFQIILKARPLSLNVEDVMSYELCSFPAPLFECEETLREATKPALTRALETELENRKPNKAVLDEIKTEKYVLDGGSLIHRLEWKQFDSYGAIVKSYAKDVKDKYGTATVVFDGYSGDPSIKDNTHQRRGANTHPIVDFNAETKFEGEKKDFLSNSCNKQRLINFMTTELKEKGCTVINALGDADVDIVKAAVEASKNHSTTVIGEDTDLLILLLYYAEPENRGLYFRSDKSNASKVYNISEIKQVLGNDFCSQLLFIHAFTGCDTTSAIYYVGKQKPFKRLVNGDSTIKSCADQFLLPHQESKVIEEHGTKAMAVLFGGQSTDSLASLRYKSFSKKKLKAKDKLVELKYLPPTESSTKYHCQRVYFQIMVWIGEEGDMNPIDWGWKMVEKRLVPVMPSKTAAPEYLLKMLCCNCTTPCRTKECICRADGSPCMPDCGCQVGNCKNR